MANVTVYNMEGNEVGTMELNDVSLQIIARVLRKLKHVLK